MPGLADVPAAVVQNRPDAQPPSRDDAGAQAPSEDEDPCVDEDDVPADKDNCPCQTNPKQEDVDFDGVGDACDLCKAIPGDLEDTDEDGFGDPCDNCPFTYNPQQADRDRDGVGDSCDNCPEHSNPRQEDDDGDRRGDACTQRIAHARRAREGEARRLEWSTSREFDLEGFWIMSVDKAGLETPLRPKPIPCKACSTGAPATYRIDLTLEEDRSTIAIRMIRVGGKAAGKATILKAPEVTTPELGKRPLEGPKQPGATKPPGTPKPPERP